MVLVADGLAVCRLSLRRTGTAWADGVSGGVRQTDLHD